MTKKEIADKYAFLQGLSLAQAQRDIEALLEIASTAFLEGKDITLKGFGTFKVVTKAARKARDIRTGETFMVPEKKTVKFMVSPELKKAMNNT